MPTVTEGIRRFLASKRDHPFILPGADLIDRFLERENLETQVNAAQDKGEPVEGRRNTWTDGTCTWFHIRVPKNANDKPEWDDYELRWAPEEHAEAVGSTGWDWKALQSRWVGFDFDDITSHAKGVGVNDTELARVAEAAQALPYVEVRKSTGGRGLHFYVLFDEEGIPTANHTEHAALARCILGMMTAEVGFDFASAIDACGQNMWLWHRKITCANQGLLLLKPATRTLSIKVLPINWRDHIEVVTRRRARVRVHGVSNENAFDLLTSSYPSAPLDSKHKAIIEALAETGYSTIWVADHHLLQTHTKALETLMNDPELRNTLGLIGHFQTSSPGNDPDQSNCFLFPLSESAWKVYRFSPGVSEASGWEQDGEGWTTCYFNRQPDFDTACRVHGGLKDPEKGEYVFDRAEQAIRAVHSLGKEIALPVSLHDRQTVLKVKDEQLIVKVERKESDNGLDGWLAKKDVWIREFSRVKTQQESSEGHERLRALRTTKQEPAGFLWLNDLGEWDTLPRSEARLALQGIGINRFAADVFLGRAINKPWTLVSRPFQPPFPGGRQVNRGAAQYRVQPLSGEHPAWDMMLSHLGAGLTKAINCSPDPWFRINNVCDGQSYLFNWLACLLRNPFESLPYLALVGPENAGKSTLPEAIEQYLLQGGVVKADRALTTEFNGELEGAVLAYVEEVDVSAPKAHARMKDIITSPTLAIRRMRHDLYHVPNTVHIIQPTNSLDYVPNWPGESRITQCWVDWPKKSVDRDIFRKQLEDQAPYFLGSILAHSLPTHGTRLRIPIVETEEKLDDAKDRAPVAHFLATQCAYGIEARIGKDEMYTAYQDWCSEHGYKNPVELPMFSRMLREFSAGRIKVDQKTKSEKGEKRRPAYVGVVLQTP